MGQVSEVVDELWQKIWSSDWFMQAKNMQTTKCGNLKDGTLNWRGGGRLSSLWLREDPSANYFKALPSNFVCESFLFFNFLSLAAPRPTMGHSRGDSLSHQMLIIVYFKLQLEGQREPRNEVGSRIPAEHLVGFEPGTFRFLSQRLESLGLSPTRTLHWSLSIPPKTSENLWFLVFKYVSPFVTTML